MNVIPNIAARIGLAILLCYLPPEHGSSQELSTFVDSLSPELGMEFRYDDNIYRSATGGDVIVDYDDFTGFEYCRGARGAAL